MSLFKTFSTNQEKEVNGVEVKYEANDDGSIPTFVIARMGGANKQFTRAYEQETKPYRRLIEAERMDPQVLEGINIRVFCRAILKGWSNVVDQDNKTITYSYENAMMVMVKLPDLFRDLWQRSTQLGLFQDDVVENATKN